MENFLLPLTSTVPILLYVFGALYALIVVILTLAVLRDAKLRQITNKGTFLVGPWSWALVVLTSGGFTGALAYWVIHYSSLRYQPRE